MNMFRKVLVMLLPAVWALATAVHAQDPASLTSEAVALEKRLKEDEALEKYKQVYVIQPSNLNAVLKLSELSGNIGMREPDAVKRRAWVEQAKGFADAAWMLDSSNAEVRYIMGLAHRNLWLTEAKQRDATAQHLRLVRQCAEQALEADPKHARAMHMLGAWHLDVVTQGGLRKAATKLLFGGLPPASIETAISLMEKVRDAEPYYCANFLDLARAYNHNRNYEKAVQTLERLVKLPTRRQDDVAIKAEGKALLQKLQ